MDELTADEREALERDLRDVIESNAAWSVDPVTPQVDSCLDVVADFLAARAARGSDLAAKVAALADEWADEGRLGATGLLTDMADDLRALLADPADTGDGSGT